MQKVDHRTTGGQEAPARELGREERATAAGMLRAAGVNALAVEDAIARAGRKEPDAAGREWRIGAHVGKMCRQLLFWEGKGEDPGHRVHKTAREWFESEAGLTRAQLRTATRVAVEEGLLEVEPGYRPSDRRPTNYYRLNVWEVARKVVASELENTERLLLREARKPRRDDLENKRRRLEGARDDLDLLRDGSGEVGQGALARWAGNPGKVVGEPGQSAGLTGENAGDHDYENTHKETPHSPPIGGARLEGREEKNPDAAEPEDPDAWFFGPVSTPSAPPAPPPERRRRRRRRGYVSPQEGAPGRTKGKHPDDWFFD